MNNNYNNQYQQYQQYQQPMNNGYPYPYPQQPPQKDNTVKIVLIILACLLLGGGLLFGTIFFIAYQNTKVVMDSARASSFILAVDKVVTAVQMQYMYDANVGAIAGSGLYVYNIKEDLELNITDTYNGYVVVDASDVDNVNYIIYIYDETYQLYGYNVSIDGMPTVDDIEAYDSTERMKYASTAVKACNNVKNKISNSKIQCYNRFGYLIS